MIKGRKALAVVAGVLAMGFVSQVVTDKIPVNLVQADQGQVSDVNTENISANIDSAEITVNFIRFCLRIFLV